MKRQGGMGLNDRDGSRCPSFCCNDLGKSHQKVASFSIRRIVSKTQQAFDVPCCWLYHLFNRDAAKSFNFSSSLAALLSPRPVSLVASQRFTIQAAMSFFTCAARKKNTEPRDETIPALEVNQSLEANLVSSQI